MSRSRFSESQVEDLPPGYRHTWCSYVRKRPSLLYCQEPARYLVITRVDAVNRKPYVVRRPVCDAHKPMPSVSDPPEPDMISTAEAAYLIGVPEMNVHSWRRREKKGRPSFIEISGRFWYRRSEVERFAQAYRIVNGLPELAPEGTTP